MLSLYGYHITKKDFKRYIQLRYTELDSLNCPAFLLIMDIKSDSPNPKPP